MSDHRAPGPPPTYAAPVIKNTPATIALVLSIAALVVNTLLLVSTAAFVVALVGLTRARTLSAHGYGPVGGIRALVALVLSVVAAFFTVFFKWLLF